jgi:flagellar assembly protein FliH
VTSTSSSFPADARLLFTPLRYREVAEPADGRRENCESTDEAKMISPNLPPWEVERLLDEARAEATVEAEKQVRAECELSLAAQTEKIRMWLTAFDTERRRYFNKAEEEVVHLALAIAAKVLHRESQVDPFLLRAMVKVSLEKLQGGSVAHLHVARADVESWQGYAHELTKALQVEVVADDQVPTGGCVLRAEMSTMDFSIGTQLKDIEKAFFDLLAQRPTPK